MNPSPMTTGERELPTDADWDNWRAIVTKLRSRTSHQIFSERVAVEMERLMFLVLAGRQARAGYAAPPRELTFTLREATQLVGAFGGSDTEVTVRQLPKGAVAPDDDADEPSPAGLYAHFDDCPEEGCLYLGPQEVDDGDPVKPFEPAAPSPPGPSDEANQGAMPVARQVCELLMTEYEASPGLPLSECSSGDLERWTEFLCCVGKNLSIALAPVSREGLGDAGEK